MTRVRPYLVLLVLWAVYFHPLVLHPAQTLYAPYSDFLAEHLPAKLFLNREWRATGEIPLWNPHHFCGSPFVHDIQVGAFYPPYAVTYLVPESYLGAALSWVIALHVLLAGGLTFVYARSCDLNEVGSLVAAVGFMLSSKWMTHLLMAGHTVTIGLAWLPLVLFLMERAIATGSRRAGLGAGVTLALLGLGTHPQWAFYAGAFALLWTRPERARLARWAVCWLGAGVLAALLAAVQLLPTLEAARWSARSGGLAETNTLKIGFDTLFALVGPSRADSQSWETQGLFGLLWLGAAAAAPLLAARWRWGFGTTCGLFVFALGGAALVEWLPGFSLFRVPSRMLIVAAFPVAVLAGAATDALVRTEWGADSRLGLSRGFRRATLAAGLPTVLGHAYSSDSDISKTFVIFCVVLLVSLVVFVRLLQPNRMTARTRTAVWCGLLLAELIAPVAPLPDVRPQAELYRSSPALEQLTSLPVPVRVLDWETGRNDGRASFLGVGAPLSMTYGIGTPRGYNPLDVRHYREFIAFVVNDPQPVRGNSVYTKQVLPNFEVGNPELFRLLSVTHRVIPADAPPVPGTWKPILTDPSPPAPPPLLPASPDPLPTHTLWTDADARPRVWIVPKAEPMPANALAALRQCDFSARVLISTDTALSPHTGTGGTAKIVEYRPNRVALDLDGGGGWLVLSDVWFPGWKCYVDGVEVEVFRANHAFRALPVPAGAKRVELVFAPWSYRVGWWVSACAMVLVSVLALLFRRVR